MSTDDAITVEPAERVEPGEPHPQFPDRNTTSVVFRGTRHPGWFTGPAAIFLGSSNPRMIGPFDSVADAMSWQQDHAPGSVIMPYTTPDEAAAL